MTPQDFEAILADRSKRLQEPPIWRDDEDHSPAQEFRVEIESDNGWPLSVYGRWNPQSEKLSYTLIHDEARRIIGLDLGDVAHPTPRGELLLGTHKHRWTAEYKDKDAYVPPDITATWDQPAQVWRQFCAEVNILHAPIAEPAIQREFRP